MKVLVPVKRVIDYNVTVRVKADGGRGRAGPSWRAGGSRRAVGCRSTPTAAGSLACIRACTASSR